MLPSRLNQICRFRKRVGALYQLKRAHFSSYPILYPVTVRSFCPDYPLLQSFLYSLKILLNLFSSRICMNYFDIRQCWNISCAGGHLRFPFNISVNHVISLWYLLFTVWCLPCSSLHPWKERTLWLSTITTTTKNNISRTTCMKNLGYLFLFY